MPLRLRKPIILCILILSWFTIWKAQTKNLAMLPNMAMIHGWIIGKRGKDSLKKRCHHHLNAHVVINLRVI